jgi:hypothetical protein
MSFAPDFSTGNFVPENYVIPDEPEQMKEFLKKSLEEMARFINRKDMGQYETVEVQVNQTFPGATPQDKRQIYRKIFEFNAIAAGATLNIAHGITGVTDFTRIYGTCITAVPDNRPIPFADVTNVTNQISVLRNGLNIVVVNGATAPNITSGRIVVEFYKG